MIGAIYAGLGDRDKALEFLEKAIWSDPLISRTFSKLDLLRPVGLPQ
jgi:hypothetical protein